MKSFATFTIQTQLPKNIPVPSSSSLLAVCWRFCSQFVDLIQLAVQISQFLLWSSQFLLWCLLFIYIYICFLCILIARNKCILHYSKGEMCSSFRAHPSFFFLILRNKCISHFSKGRCVTLFVPILVFFLPHFVE